MHIPSSLIIPLRTNLLMAIAALALILAVVLILIFRRRCPQRLPRCLRPSDSYEIFTVEFALDEITVDADSSSAFIPLQAIYSHSPASTVHPAPTVQSMNATTSQFLPAFYHSSHSSSSGSDGSPRLDNDQRGRKRSRISSSYDDWRNSSLILTL